jgi:phospholipid/cholesterol/gamma-HCH transport system substrate-binding protein
MRSSKINYLVVGVFVIGMVVALVGSIALLTGRTGATDNYHAYYANVTGVKFGTQVVYEGYPIGQVEAVIPEEKDGRMQFRVNFGVTQGWRIPNDSIGEVAAPGLLAAVTLSIKAGRSKVALKPGEQIISKERSDVFAVVSSVAGQLGELTEKNIKPLLTHVDTAVQGINRIIEKEGETLFQDARKVTNDLSVLVGLMAERVPRIADDIEEFASKMNVTADQFQKLMTPANREKMENAISNLDAASAKVDAMLDSINTLVEDGDVKTTLGETRYIVESVSRHIDSINQNMEGAARNMYEFTRQIRQNPSLLLGSEPPEDKSKSQ